MDILAEPGFLEHVRVMSARFADGFDWLMDKHPLVLVEAHQRGLMMGLKLANDNLGPLMTQLGFEAGLLTIYANNDPAVIQVLPPLIIQENEVRLVIDILDLMLTKVEELVR